MAISKQIIMSKTVALFMIKNPVSITVDKSIKQVMSQMDKSKVSHLLVEDEDGLLEGVISQQDILTKIKQITEQSSGQTYASLEMNSLRAADIMTSKPIAIKPDDSVEYAVELLLQKQFHCLPVIKENKAVGIVTFYDLLKGYYQEFG